MGSSKSHNRAQISKESHLFWIVWAFWGWGEGLFVPDRHRWQNLGSPLWAGDEKAVNGVASSAIIRKKKFKTTPSTRKVVIAVLGDIDGVILVDVMARGETINLDKYIKTLQKLKQHYQRMQPNRNPGDMLIQHNNAHPHTSLWTQEAIAKCGWTMLPHPPYSPDLAPSDFHLFGQLKDALYGTRFEDDENVIHAVRTWLREQETSRYREGMCALVMRWR